MADPGAPAPTSDDVLSSGVTWEQGGMRTVPARLTLTSGNRLVLVQLDGDGASTTPTFDVPASEARVRILQRYITVTVAGRRYALIVDGTVQYADVYFSDLVLERRAAHRAQVPGWSRALRAAGAKVSYLGYGGAMLIGLGLAIVIVVGIFVGFALNGAFRA
ncbi:MAG TPA: hypothetical protein VGM70_10240 [Pseudolysinimonas sp.]|jgi:hypothetical protein